MGCHEYGLLLLQKLPEPEPEPEPVPVPVISSSSQLRGYYASARVAHHPRRGVPPARLAASGPLATQHEDGEQ